MKSGYTENIYQKAMEVELKLREVLFETEKNLKIYYKNEIIGDYKIDFLVDNKIVIELKAVQEFCDVHIAQVISYLKATRLRNGLLLNFSKSKIDIKRIVWDEK